MREKFMFFQNFMDTANKLPDDMRLKYYDAIMDYVFNGNEPSDPIMAALINSIKPSLDKEETRGGNHNPTGQNQYKEVKSGQTGQNGSKGGQSGQSFLETETETRNRNIETEIIEKENTKEKVTLITPFDEFWTYYPKQRAGSKDKARIAFQKAIDSHRASAEQIIESCKAYAKSDEVERGFAKGAAAWLNDDRFNSNYEPHKTKQQVAFEKAYEELQALYDDESEVANVG